ncbi:endonuclease/exonuclease/phosphatase family protein [Albimonas sp. CAU 1670]|uniref:endonuclease/exonuclease/phosphatase family protein n=1 Tax=Albimonas sp. CAU 1670 TaxID=3032599 RepID=UPI0023DBD136|nr:endonuclease/exonuclease/phosphatase family protein [Albimonas sp. CAU 1670]MDF2232023.1 endonuclease/exonuclease/phosphatase family protein [Albimonas sp. CAU 1670]
MRLLLRILLVLATGGLVVLTFLSVLETNLWWVRMTDFPRLQYALALVALLVALALARPAGRGLRLGLAALALAALGFNATRIAPYFYTAEGDAQASCPAESRLRVMVANVKRENRRAEPLLALVEARAPDVLLALETNAWWDERLSPLSSTMPHAVSEISADHFGMHLFSTRPLEGAEAVFPVAQDTPAILATVRLPSGEGVRFIGLHPRPPHPGQSATGRDGELMWAAMQARGSQAPAVLAGDFNAVPWERTVERAQRIGALLDPREVAGFLPTYDAKSWWMSWPLDQVLHQEGLRLAGMRVLEGFGSDHYPVEADLCLEPAGRPAPVLREDDLAEAERSMEAARAEPGKG